MKFPDGALLQMLLGSCNVMALWQILYNLLTHPASVEDFGLRIRESPFQVRYGSGIGALFAQIGRVIEVDLMVCAAFV
jgi:hypothetical protein